MRHDDDMSLKLYPQFLIIHLFCEAIGSFQLKLILPQAEMYIRSTGNRVQSNTYLSHHVIAIGSIGALCLGNPFLLAPQICQ
jgi:hypothetical protein